MTMRQTQAQSPTATTDDTTMLDEILADVVAAGKDTTALSRDDRAALLVGLARKLGLNALSGAVMFLRTQGRETLYVTKQGTDQIAARERLKRETIRGPEVVAIEGRKVVLCQVRATHPDGRSEVSTATLALSDVVNDLMKCECVPLDSEILTRRGFKRHDEVTIGEDVLAYDCNTNTCEWVPLENVTVYPSAPVSRFATAGGGFSFRCTPNHSWAVDTMGAAGRKLIEASAVKTHHRVRIAAPAVGGDHPLTPDLAAIIGWIMCDGGIRRTGNHVRLTITQSKPHRVDEIRLLLARAGLNARETVGDETVRAFPGGNVSRCLPQHVFTLRAIESRTLLSLAGIEGPADLPRLATRLSQPARRAMLAAMMAADGTDRGHFGKKRKPGVMEAWQILSTLEGLALGKMGVSSAGDVPVQKTLSYDYVAGANLSLTPDGEAAVWCPTTRHGTWVMRQGGRISITGNTKAKRRATLSVCGLGLLAEDEIETIPGAEPVVVAPPVSARLDATTLNAMGVEQRLPATLPVNEDAEPTAFELAARALVNAPSLAALRDEWVRVMRDVWPSLGPAERDALTREKDTRKATLGQPTPPDGDPPKGRRTRRPTAPVDATSAPQEAAPTPGDGPAAWAPVTLSNGRVVRSAEEARALLRTYPEPRLHSSARAHGGEWAALCDAELLARAAMARRAA